jgi:hypothetical protein
MVVRMTDEIVDAIDSAVFKWTEARQVTCLGLFDDRDR